MFRVLVTHRAMIAAVSVWLSQGSLVSCTTGHLLADEAVAASAAAAGVAEQARDASADMAEVERRMREPLWQDVPDATARSLFERIRDDGSWADVDYGDRSRSGWSTIHHLSNVAILARAYRSPNSAFHADGRARNAALAGLDYWLDHDFRNPNWWWNEIGVPRTLLPIVLLLRDDLTADQRDRCLAILRRAKIGMTGQNLVWVTQITAGRGLLEHDAELVARAYARMSDEIRISTGEGIQPDFSFHQHGPCLYNHGYGAAFAVDCSRIATEVAGTRFALPQDKLAVLSGLILDGSQWMTRGSATDFGAEGREITRAGQDASYLRTAAAKLLQLPSEREQELRELVDRAAGRNAPPLVGNRHFWCSDMMTHHREAFLSSARMVSRRIANTDDPCNGEGLKSHHLADGCHIVMRTGGEYEGIFPVWDWQMIPGTTVEQVSPLSGSPRRQGTTDFVGGVSDGEYGLAAFDLVRETLNARKSWFFFDQQIVCLGAGIRCESDNRVLTTWNQCNLTGDVVAAGVAVSGLLPRGEHVVIPMRSATVAASDAPEITRATAWVWHDQVAYLSLDTAPIHLRNAPQHGVWRDINQRYSSDEIQRDVFSVWLDHGSGPEDATYAYVVVPGVAAPSVAALAGSLPVRVLRNDREAQAIWHGALDLGGFAFYEPGLCRVRPDLALSVSKPCLVLLRFSSDELSISISDPTHTLSTVEVEMLDGTQAAGGNASPRSRSPLRLSCAFPEGPKAGRSVTRRIPRSLEE